MAPKVTYVRKRTHFAHAYLKKGAEHLLRLAEKCEEGRTYTSMMSIVATAFFLEAYLNHLGSKRVNSWNEYERCTPEAKLLLLCKELKIKPDWGKRPYQSFRKSISFRNRMAHGKTMTEEDNMKRRLGHITSSDTLSASWTKDCTPRVARRVFEDGVKIAEQLHRGARLPGTPFGMMGEGSAHSV